MNDVNVSAPEADQQVVVDVDTEAETPEVVESTEGQAENQPAEDEGSAPEAEDKPSASKARRERRKAAQERAEKALADAEAEALTAKERADALEEQMRSTKMPQEADFATYEEYQASLNAYKSIQMLDERTKAQATREHEQSQERVKAAKQARMAELQQNWVQQANDARTRYPDFDSVVMAERTPLSAIMQEMVMDSDLGAEIAYQLCKNPDEALAIGRLSPLEQARRLGALEASLSRPPASKVTKAPDPVTPIGGAGGATADPTKMTVDQYRAWRAAGGKF